MLHKYNKGCVIEYAAFIVFYSNIVFYFFLIKVSQSLNVRITTSTRGSEAIKSLKARIPCVW